MPAAQLTQWLDAATSPRSTPFEAPETGITEPVAAR
jgi:hypothetical protein